MLGLVNQGSGLKNYFGTGADGAFDASTYLSTTISGISIDLIDGSNATGDAYSVTTYGDILFSFQYPQIVRMTNFEVYSRATTSTLNCDFFGSNDNTNWTQIGYGTFPTTAGLRTFFDGGEQFFRYYKLAASSTVTRTGTIYEIYPTIDVNYIPLYTNLDENPIIKNYSSITIPSGYTVSTYAPVQGLVLYCTGNVDISGTLTMTSKAPQYSDIFTALPITKEDSSGLDAFTKYLQLATVLEIIRGGAGGNGGNGGAATSALTRASGGTAGTGRIGLGGYGGGGGGGAGNYTTYFGAGGTGGSISSAAAGGSIALNNTGILMNAASLLGTGMGGTHGQYGSGGQGGSWCNQTGSADPIGQLSDGGACYGAGGGGGGGSSGARGADDGLEGNYAGGFILIICQGSLTINASGIISSNGGNGGNGGKSYCLNDSTTYPSGGGGGGGGSGGGVVVLYHKGSYSNSGSITVTGGTAGSGGAKDIGGYEAGFAGSAGSVGTIIVEQIV